SRIFIARPLLCIRDFLVYSPFRRIPIFDGRQRGSELLLDSGPLRTARYLRMMDARILVNLAKQVLAIDKLQWPPPQVFEIQTKPCELAFLTLRHNAYQIRFA